MAIERLFIGEGVKEAEVKQYLTDELKRAGLASIEIQRTPLVTKIVLYCDRPALVIGRKGSNVKAITKTIEQDFRIEKPEIEVKKVDKPNLEPSIVAYRIASALERGMNSRKVGYKALKAVMRDNAKGAEIILSGKLVGKGGRARSLKMKAGYMKKCGHPSIEQVKVGETIATCKAGTIGIEVRIVPQNVHFPDEINLVSPEDFEIEEEIIEEPEEKEEKKTKKKPKKVEKTEGTKEKILKEKKEETKGKKTEEKKAKKKEEKPAKEAEKTKPKETKEKVTPKKEAKDKKSSKEEKGAEKKTKKETEKAPSKKTEKKGSKSKEAKSKK
jgi:small subunit ribosomal protein S3